MQSGMPRNWPVDECPLRDEMVIESMKHPYLQFDKTPLWLAIDFAISELERNRGVELTTSRNYVIGYLCQQLSAKQLVTPKSITSK